MPHEVAVACKAALNMLVDVASTMWPGTSGSEFHASITRLEKKCRLKSCPWLLQFERVSLIACRSC